MCVGAVVCICSMPCSWLNGAGRWAQEVEGGYCFHPNDIQNACPDKKFNVVLQLVTSSTFILSDSWVSHFMPWWPLPGTAVWMWPLSLAQFGFWGAVKDWLLPHPVCGLLLLSKTNTEYNSLSCSKLGMPKQDIRCCILEIDTGNQYDSACGQKLRH